MSLPQQLVLTRFQEDDKQTLGTLELYTNKEKIFKCKTLELSDKNNQKDISRIPEGHYEVKKHISPNFGNSLWIKDVPNRSEILIHKGNYYTDILGCILVGKEHIDINNDGLKDITSSKNTINLLYSVVEEPVYINIINEV